MRHCGQSSSGRRGSGLIEFAFCSVIWIPLLLGTIFIGINVTRSIEVTQICRDAGHMYAYGVDFSQPGNQAILIQLATGFDISSTGGNGVFILSTVMYVGPEQCAAGGLAADSTNCTNLNQTVFTRRLIVGNASLRGSTFGTPPSRCIGTGGNISSAGYLSDATTRVSGFPSTLTLSAGQNAYLAEAYFSSPDLNWNNFSSNQGIYSSFIF